MVKKFVIIITIALAFAACNSSDADNNDANDSTDVSLTAVSLSDFDAKAQDYVDVEIQVSGIVDHICRHGGKKLLLVNENGDASIHIDSDVRFEDTLAGSNVTVIGIVRELVIDEAYCQQLDDDAMTNHTGDDDNVVSDDDNHSQKNAQAQYYRDSMATAGVDHLSFYSLEFVSFK